MIKIILILLTIHFIIVPLSIAILQFIHTLILRRNLKKEGLPINKLFKTGYTLRDFIAKIIIFFFFEQLLVYRKVYKKIYERN